MFNKNDKILLIGDSITDAGRISDPEQVGTGYFRLVRDYYVSKFPELNLSFFNKGVGGDRVIDLEKRWMEDVIKHEPNWLSISIGINDVWRQLDSPEMEQVYPDRFRKIYRLLLEELVASTNAKLILMEPTIIEEDTHSKGNELLQDYLKVIHELANEYKAVLVPTHQAFKNYLENNPRYLLTTDGVHMTSTGNMLMASTWIDALSKA